MTWDEFKEHVDSSIAKQGVDGSIELWLIDIAAETDSEYLDVKIHDGYLTIEG
jgi:hypothetical protein